MTRLDGHPRVDATPAYCPTPWPDPLAEEAYYGLPGEIVRTIEPHSEANPAAILVQALIASGSAIGRIPYLRAEADSKRP